MANSGGLDLSQDAWLNMVNLPAHNMRAAAEGMKVIKPCDPEHSLLYVKLTSDSYGAQRPLGNPALSAAALKRIHDWIARGALLSEPATAQGSVCTY